MPPPNVNSRAIRELATQLAAGKVSADPSHPPCLADAAKLLNLLADIHEGISDYEFNSETCDFLMEAFANHNLPLFQEDSSLGASGLQEKYAGEGDEPQMPGEHGCWTKKRWLEEGASGATVKGYWDWVDDKVTEFEGEDG